MKGLLHPVAGGSGASALRKTKSQQASARGSSRSSRAVTVCAVAPRVPGDAEKRPRASWTDTVETSSDLDGNSEVKGVEGAPAHDVKKLSAAGYTTDELKSAVEYLKRGLVDEEGAEDEDSPQPLVKGSAHVRRARTTPASQVPPLNPLQPTPTQPSPQSAAPQSAATAPAAPAAPTAVPAPKPVVAPPPKVKSKEELAHEAARAAAKVEVQRHVPAAAAMERMHWLVFTVPEKPVAGEEVVIYLNRAQSDVLRNRPRILAQVGFNQWELTHEDSKLDMVPAPIPRDEFTDFWSCKVKVPDQAFEMNFVFGDNEGGWENNLGQDFTFPVTSTSTWETWVDTAAERALASELMRIAAEKAAAEQAERERQIAMKEQDKQKAIHRVNEVRNAHGQMREGGTTMLMAADGRIVYTVEPAAPRAGSPLRLYLNIKPTSLGWLAPLPEGKTITVKFGFNGWKKPGSVSMERVKQLPRGVLSTEGDDWFEGVIEVPEDGAALNFVTNYESHWDNNGSKDYKVPLDVPLAYGGNFESWLEALLDVFVREEYEQRVEAEEAERVKQEARAIKRQAAMESVQAVQRKQLRHVLYTEPENIKVGQEVTLYYNPSNTCLQGRETVWLTGGWNRWTHRRTFGPIEMTPPLEGFHFSAKVKVPADAYQMDFVFSDTPAGEGTYDNRLGLDYHLPIAGSPIKGQPLHIVHIAVEMAPIAKVGGLGDVVTALGRAVKDQGHMVEVILPRYQFFANSPMLTNVQFEKEFAWGGTNIYVTSAIVEGLRVFLIEPRNGFFNTQTVYGQYDDEVRFDFFCNAALEFLLQTQRQPDVLHCHDWSTAHVAQSYWENYHPFGLYKPKVVFTIHNLEYGQKKIGQAAFYSQKFTTVSPTYACEIGEHAVIAPNAQKFMGLRNGIDMELWDPENNQWLPMPYGPEKVVEGKAAARQRLRERLGLTSWNDKFIVGVVSRLTPQKGMHLIKHAAFRTLDRGGQFVLLGSAPDPKVQADFDEFAHNYNGQDAKFTFKYDEPLSHLIYAACDMILVPSMFEPCGLTQMIAMRFGAVPVVRHTGGLKDTVFDVDFDKGRAAWDMLGSTNWEVDGDATNGFAFEGTDDGALDYALNRAIDAWYNDKAWFHTLQRRVMEQDWSWNRPAMDYIELYHSAIKM